MDVCININTPLSQTVTSLDESSLSDITDDISESPNVQGQDSCEGSRQSKMTDLTPKKILSKSSTFPSSNKMSMSDREIEEKEAVDGVVDINPKLVSQPCQRSISLPAPSKLRSALKGSREKHGIQIINDLTVKWAPDVYDPIPTAVSHVVTPNKNQTRNNTKKNNGKNKQKRRARGKDKKQQQQATKYGGGSTSGSNKSLKSLDDDVGVVKCEEGPRTDLGDFNVTGPDPHCGSSFLKESVTKMHFSLAEAT